MNDLGSHELSQLDAINDQIVDDMNDSVSWAQASRCYELLKDMEDINNPYPWVVHSIKSPKLMTWTLSCHLIAQTCV